jgi:hypothetical protein
MPKNKKAEVEVLEPATETKQPTKRQLFRAQIVTVVATENPKKKGSMSYDRFQDYFGLKGGESIDWVLRNTSVRMDDIRHDSDHGFITLAAPAA